MEHAIHQLTVALAEERGEGDPAGDPIFRVTVVVTLQPSRTLENLHLEYCFGTLEEDPFSVGCPAESPPAAMAQSPENPCEFSCESVECNLFFLDGVLSLRLSHPNTDLQPFVVSCGPCEALRDQRFLLAHPLEPVAAPLLEPATAPPPSAIPALTVSVMCFIRPPNLEIVVTPQNMELVTSASDRFMVQLKLGQPFTDDSDSGDPVPGGAAWTFDPARGYCTAFHRRLQKTSTFFARISCTVGPLATPPHAACQGAGFHAEPLACSVAPGTRDGPNMRFSISCVNVEFISSLLAKDALKASVKWKENFINAADLGDIPSCTLHRSAAAPDVLDCLIPPRVVKSPSFIRLVASLAVVGPAVSSPPPVPAPAAVAPIAPTPADPQPAPPPPIAPVPPAQPQGPGVPSPSKVPTTPSPTPTPTPTTLKVPAPVAASPTTPASHTPAPPPHTPAPPHTPTPDPHTPAPPAGAQDCMAQAYRAVFTLDRPDVEFCWQTLSELCEMHFGTLSDLHKKFLAMLHGMPRLRWFVLDAVRQEYFLLLQAHADRTGGDMRQIIDEMRPILFTPPGPGNAIMTAKGLVQLTLPAKRRLVTLLQHAIDRGQTAFADFLALGPAAAAQLVPSSFPALQAYFSGIFGAEMTAPMFSIKVSEKINELCSMFRLISANFVDLNIPNTLLNTDTNTVQPILYQASFPCGSLSLFEFGVMMSRREGRMRHSLFYETVESTPSQRVLGFKNSGQSFSILLESECNLRSISFSKDFADQQATFQIQLHSNTCKVVEGRTGDFLLLPCTRRVQYVSDGDAFFRLALCIPIAGGSAEDVEHCQQLLQQMVKCSVSIADEGVLFAALLHANLPSNKVLDPYRGGLLGNSANINTVRLIRRSLQDCNDFWVNIFTTNVDDRREIILGFLKRAATSEETKTIAIVSAPRYMEDINNLLSQTQFPDIRCERYTIEPSTFDTAISELEDLATRNATTIVLVWFQGLVSPTAFPRFLGLFSPQSSLRLVLFNTSFTDSLLRMSQRHVPWLVHMPTTAEAVSFTDFNDYSNLAGNPIVDLVRFSHGADEADPRTAIDNTAFVAECGTRCALRGRWEALIDESRTPYPSIVLSVNDEYVRERLVSLQCFQKACFISVDDVKFRLWLSGVVNALTQATERCVVFGAHLFSADEISKIVTAFPDAVLVASMITAPLSFARKKSWNVLETEESVDLIADQNERLRFSILRLMFGGLLHTSDFDPANKHSFHSENYSDVLFMRCGMEVEKSAVRTVLSNLSRPDTLIGKIFRTCEANVVSARPPAMWFEDYCRHHPAAQVLCQTARCRQWLRILNNGTDVDYLDQLWAASSNVHGLTLFSLFGTKGGIAPHYAAPKRDVMVSMEDVLMRQASQPVEMNWHLIQQNPSGVRFPFSRQHLVRMLSTYIYPLKLLSFVDPRILFEFLDGVGSSESDVASLRRTCEHLFDPALQSWLHGPSATAPQQAVLHGPSATAPHQAVPGHSFSQHVAVLRWIIISQDILKRLELTHYAAGAMLSPSDVAGVVSLNIFLSNVEAVSSSLIPCVLCMDIKPSDPNFITSQVNLRAFLESCNNEELFLAPEGLPKGNEFRGFPIGSMFLDYFLRHVPDAEKLPGTLLKHSFLAAIRSLVSDSGDEHESGHSPSFWANFSNLQPGAIAYLVTRCQSSKQAATLWQYVASHLCRKSDPNAFKAEVFQALYECSFLYDFVCAALASSAALYGNVDMFVSSQLACVVDAVRSQTIARFLNHRVDVPLDGPLHTHLGPIIIRQLCDGGDDMSLCSSFANLVSPRGFKNLQQRKNPQLHPPIPENSWLNVIAWLKYPCFKLWTSNDEGLQRNLAERLRTYIRDQRSSAIIEKFREFVSSNLTIVEPLAVYLGCPYALDHHEFFRFRTTLNLDPCDNAYVLRETPLRLLTGIRPVVSLPHAVHFPLTAEFVAQRLPDELLESWKRELSRSKWRPQAMDSLFSWIEGQSEYDMKNQLIPYNVSSGADAMLLKNCLGYLYHSLYLPLKLPILNGQRPSTAIDCQYSMPPVTRMLVLNDFGFVLVTENLDQLPFSASPSPGVLFGDCTLKLSPVAPNIDLYFTLDGSLPWDSGAVCLKYDDTVGISLRVGDTLRSVVIHETLLRGVINLTIGVKIDGVQRQQYRLQYFPQLIPVERYEAVRRLMQFLLHDKLLTQDIRVPAIAAHVARERLSRELPDSLDQLVHSVLRPRESFYDNIPDGAKGQGMDADGAEARKLEHMDGDEKVFSFDPEPLKTAYESGERDPAKLFERVHAGLRPCSIMMQVHQVQMQIWTWLHGMGYTEGSVCRMLRLDNNPRRISLPDSFSDPKKENLLVSSQALSPKILTHFKVMFRQRFEGEQPEDKSYTTAQLIRLCAMAEDFVSQSYKDASINCIEFVAEKLGKAIKAVVDPMPVFLNTAVQAKSENSVCNLPVASSSKHEICRTETCHDEVLIVDLNEARQLITPFSALLLHLLYQREDNVAIVLKLVHAMFRGLQSYLQAAIPPAPENAMKRQRFIRVFHSLLFDTFVLAYSKSVPQANALVMEAYEALRSEPDWWCNKFYGPGDARRPTLSLAGIAGLYSMYSYGAEASFRNDKWDIFLLAGDFFPEMIPTSFYDFEPDDIALLINQRFIDGASLSSSGTGLDVKSIRDRCKGCGYSAPLSAATSVDGTPPLSGTIFTLDAQALGRAHAFDEAIELPLAPPLKAQYRLVDASHIVEAITTTNYIAVKVVAGGLVCLAPAPDGEQHYGIIRPVIAGAHAAVGNASYEPGKFRIFESHADCWTFLEQLLRLGTIVSCRGLFFDWDSGPRLTLDYKALMASVAQGGQRLPPFWLLFPDAYKKFGYAWWGGVGSVVDVLQEMTRILRDQAAQAGPILSEDSFEPRPEAVRDITSAVLRVIQARSSAGVERFGPKLQGHLDDALASPKSCETLRGILEAQTFGNPGFSNFDSNLDRFVMADSTSFRDQITMAPRMVMRPASAQPPVLAWIDAARYSNVYSPIDGLDVAFAMRIPRLRDRPFVDTHSSRILAMTRGNDLTQEELEGHVRDWLVCMLLSPLSSAVKDFFWELICNGEKPQFPSFMLDADSRVVVHALAQALPIFMPPESGMETFLRDLAGLPDVLDKLCRRAGNRYGIHGVDHLSDVESVLKSPVLLNWYATLSRNSSSPPSTRQRQLKATSLEIDQSLYSDDSSHEALYRLIYTRLGHGCTFLFVKGIKTASDPFIKWCCEFTYRRPWVYIYFQGLETSFFLPEIIDRFCFHKLQSSVVGGSSSLARLTMATSCLGNLPGCFNVTNLSQYSNGFEATIRKDISGFLEKAHVVGDQQLWGLAGPPGVGKSFAKTQVIDHFQRHNRDVGQRSGGDQIFRWMEIDGSSDELVHVSIHDKLEGEGLFRLPQDQRLRFVVIIDEFHLMRLEQRKALVEICYRQGCSLLVIANRLDQGDMHIFTHHYACGDTKPGRVKILHCQAQEAILMVKGTQGAAGGADVETRRRQRFFKLWLRVTRILLGEEMWSFRFLRVVMHAYSTIGQTQVPLARSLCEKMRHLNDTFAREFESAFLRLLDHDLHTAGVGGLSLDESGDWLAADKALLAVSNARFEEPRNFVELLIQKAAVVTTNVMSYPEFNRSSECVPKPAETHPAHKLAAFTCYLARMAGQDVASENFAKFTSLFSGFSIIEVPDRFPHVDMSFRLGRSPGLAASYVVCSAVDPNNLDAVKQAVVRGYSVDPKRAKEEWPRNSVTDVSKFEMVASILPAAISWVTPDNLRVLLRSASANFVVKVMSYFQQSRNDDTERKSTSFTQQPTNDNPFFMAAWRLYSLHSSPLLLRTVFDRATGTAKVFVRLHDQAAEIDLIAVLEWASQYGYTMTGCAAPGAKAASTRGDLMAVSLALRDQLLLQGSDDACRRAWQRILALWSGFFAPLLKPTSGITPGGDIPHATLNFWTVAIVVAAGGNALCAWDASVVYLSTVYGGAFPEKVLDDLAPLLPVIWARGIAAPAELTVCDGGTPTAVARLFWKKFVFNPVLRNLFKCMDIKMDINASWQEAIVTTDVDLDEVVADPVSSAVSLEKGILRSVATRSPLLLRGVLGDKVREMAVDLFGRETVLAIAREHQELARRASVSVVLSGVRA